MVVVVEILSCQIEDGFSLKRLNKSHADVEKERPFQVGLIRYRNLGRVLRATQSQFSFVLTFVKVIHASYRQKIGKGSMRWAAIEGINLISEQARRRIGAEIGCDLLGARFIDAN